MIPPTKSGHAAALGLFAPIALWALWQIVGEGYLCRLPVFTVAGKDDSCLEFWLNRYQTILGAVAALGAGFLAYRAALGQIARADKQAEIMRQQVSVALLDPVSRRLQQLRGLQASINRCATEVLRCQISSFECRNAAHLDMNEEVLFTAAMPPMIRTGETARALKEHRHQVEALRAAIDNLRTLYESAMLQRVIARDIANQLYTLEDAYQHHDVFRSELRDFAQRFDDSGQRSSVRAVFRTLQASILSLGSEKVTGHAVEISPSLVEATERLQSLLDQLLLQAEAAVH